MSRYSALGIVNLLLRSSIMLATLALLFVHLTAPRAQYNSEYHFTDDYGILNGADIHNPASLAIQPSADFIIGLNGTFSSNYGAIGILNGSGILDPSHTSSSNTNGHSTFIGTTSITNSAILGYVQTNDSANIMRVRPCVSALSGYSYDNCSTSATQFYASSDFFINVNDGGLARIDFDANSTTHQISNVVLDASTFDYFQVYGINLVNDFSITGSTFENIRNSGIYLTRDGSGATAYNNMTISGNSFNQIDALPGLSDPLCGIFLNGYYTSAMEKVDIEDNTFSTSSAPSTMNYAIVMQNSKGGIIHNTISGGAYKAGIWQMTVGSPPSQLNSLICMNRISGCTASGGAGFGISADHYYGYTKLNQISSCDIGYVSYKSDNGHMIFCNIHDNGGPGLNITDATSAIDLAGVHGPSGPSPDYAAYDTIASNTTTEIATVSGSLLRLGNTSIPWTWTNFSENNIIGSDSYPYLISSSGGSTNLYSIDQNYWGGVDPKVTS